ncbi:Membrane-associated zinc metalloprotease [Chitinispirillum alkaliphilum]|nr:Membrane-associated zinc metalloprotease [Chitinispirillum alkaliphilum]
MLVLGILVLVHELGHFLAAKACKIKVLTFSIGFGRALIKKKYGDTEYRLSSIPFGGYVRMAGDNPEEQRSGSPDEFNSKPVWQRAVVALAGPVANLVFAVLLLWFIFIYGVARPVYMDNLNIGGVIENSSAQEAGFLPGDSILAINNQTVESWDDIENHFTRQQKQYEFTILRNNTTYDKTLNIEYSESGLPQQPVGGLLPPVPAVIGGINPDSPAEQAQLEKQDSVIAINGENVYSFYHLSTLINNHNREELPLTFTVKRGDTVLNKEITPEFNSEKETYIIGITVASPETELVRFSPLAAIPMSMEKTWEYTTMIFQVIGQLISREVSTNQLAGPLGIIPASGLMAMQGLSPILNFMALIGINLAVLNLLPLVITDGGMLFFLGLEAIRKKPLSPKTQANINKVAIIFFLALFLFVSINDVKRLPEILRIFN